MPIRLSGLASGLDTEAIVGALVSAYSYKKDKYTKAQTKLSWKQDAWKTLNSKVYNLYTSVGNMRYSSNYSLKKTTVSDNTKAKATASGNAINGTQTLEIKQLASTAYLTSGKLDDSITGDSSLNVLGIKSGTLIGSGTITVRTGNKVTDINLDSTMSVDQLVGKFKDAGIEANFDSKNHRFYLSSKSSGKDGDFSISAKNSMGLDGLMKLGLMSDSEIKAIQSTLNATDEDGNTTAVTNLVKKSWMYDGMGTGTNSSLEIGNEEDFVAVLTTIKEGKVHLKELEDNPITDESDPGYVAYQEDLDKTRQLVDETYGSKGKLAKALEEKYSITDWSTVDVDNIAAKMYKDAKYEEHAAEATAYEISTALNAVRDKYVELSKAKAMPQETDIEKAARDTAISEAQKAIDDVLKDDTTAKWADYIEKNFGAKNEGETDKYAYSNFWTQSDNLELANSVFYRVDLAAKVDGKEINFDNVNTATKVDGQDSKIILNNVEYTGSTNSITVNGLTVECLAKTDSAINITVQSDTDSLYDKVKDFLNTYNSLITEMQKLYNADSAKDYEPLTDDEKAELSETEIEKWEQKIKDSLLRRDTSLSSLISTMTMSMMKTYDINGKTYSWSTFGVHTLGTLNSSKNENYNYHIDGDSEDTKTSGNEDKLRSALAEDPETVIEFLKQMSSGLYSDLDKKMKSTAVKSVYTVYNDKEMASEYSNYNSLIKTWSDRVQDMEDSYYKKFSAMEKALATLQSNSSSITSMLG